MSQSAAHITRVPLQELFDLLKTRGGFNISTSIILDVQRILANYDPKPAEKGGLESSVSIAELKFLIAPLICRNKEEQEKFYDLFDEYQLQIKKEVEKEAEKKLVNPTAIPFSFASKGRSLKYYSILGIVAIAILSSLYYYYLYCGNKPKIFISMTGHPAVNDTVFLHAKLTDTCKGEQYTVLWGKGNNTYDTGRLLAKIFTTTGSKNITASIKVEDRVIDTASKVIMVECERRPEVSISKYREAGDTVIYKAAVQNPSPDSSLYKYKWFINNRGVASGPQFTYLSKEDSFFTLKVAINCNGANCSTDSMVAFLYETPSFGMSIKSSQPFKRDPTLIPLMQIVANFLAPAFGLLLLPLISIFFCNWLIEKMFPRPEPPLVPNGPDPFTDPTEKKEYTEPYTIEFERQDGKINSEEAIDRLADILRKRHVSETYSLNISKTISKTVQSGGFPSLAFSPKTKAINFLAFIDREYPESHMVKLFEFLVERLRGEQVNITTYKYYKEPRVLTNEKLNHYSLPVDKVMQLYPDTALFIFGNTDSFFIPFKVELRDWAIDILNGWEIKIIFTPRTKDDWDFQEAVLLNAGFMVLPADLHMPHIIESTLGMQHDKERRSKTTVSETYSSRPFNFNKVSDLQKYLAGDDDSLFQWVCSLATYPYLDWKITIAVGKALDDAGKKKNKKSRLISYRNLLKLSRISWMQQGMMPDELRLELLKKLENNSEAIARRAILGLLNELSKKITPSSLVLQEYNLHKSINKFLLDVYNGNSISAEDFSNIKKYVTGNYLDWPLRKYIEDPNNNTLIIDPVSLKCISLDNYLETAENKIEEEKIIPETAYTKLNKDYIDDLWERNLVVKLLDGWIYIILASTSLAFLPEKSNFTFKQSASVKLHFTLPSNRFIPSFTTYGVKIGENSSNALSVNPDGSAVIPDFLIRDTSEKVQFSFTNNGGKLIASDSFKLNSDSFTISILPNIRTNVSLYYNSESAKIFAEMLLQNLPVEYYVTLKQQSFSDPGFVVYYGDSAKISKATAIANNINQHFIETLRDSVKPQYKAGADIVQVYINILPQDTTPVINNLDRTPLIMGNSLTIFGKNIPVVRGSVAVYFNNVSAYITSIKNDAIVVKVPVLGNQDTLADIDVRVNQLRLSIAKKIAVKIRHGKMPDTTRPEPKI